MPFKFLPAVFRFLVGLVILCAPVFSNAQVAPNNPTPSGAGRTQGLSSIPYERRPAIGTIMGQVLDSLSGEPMEFATVALYTLQPDSLVGGGITDAKGRFELSAVRVGRYRLLISFLGYGEKNAGPVIIRPDQPLADIGAVRLGPQGEMLQAVEISGERAYMQLGIDRKVYNVEKDLSTKGGDALDAMRNIPSLDVGVEGNVSLRGSENVSILIDGKPSGLTGSSRTAILEQLPASAIESIEVITNPSARYNPDGTAGIINIVTRKDRKAGLSGGLTAGVGTNEKYNASGNINYRNGDINLYANYGYRNIYAFSERSTYRESNTGETEIILDQDYRGYGLSQAHSGKLGMDWYLDPKTTLSLGAMINADERDRSGPTYYRYLDGNALLEDLDIQRESDDESGWNADVDFRFDKRFSQPEQQLLFDARYSLRSETEQEFNELTSWVEDRVLLNQQPFRRNNTELSDAQLVTAQVDYIHPHYVTSGDKQMESWRIETGAQYIGQRNETDYASVVFDTLSGLWVTDALVSNVFRLNADIFSVYGNFRKRWSRWGVQGGLRIEQALTDPQLLTTGEVFDNDYFSLFPSLYVTRDLGKKLELQLNYSRRINRPSRWALNPFIDNSDPLNIRIGNPDLQPEYVHSAEFNLAKTWDQGHALTGSLFFRQTDGVIRNYRVIDSNGISTQFYDNFDWQRDYGVELIAVVEAAKWLRWSASGSAFRANFDAGDGFESLNNANYSWSVKTNANVTLPGKIFAQVSFRYRGPTVTAQGTFIGIPELDAAVQRSFVSDKLSVSLRVSDLLNKQRFGYVLDDPGFFQDSYFKRESRIGWLTLSYKFGTQTFERRRSAGGSEGGGDFSPDMGE